MTCYDIPDLVLYLGVVIVSLGEMVEVSGGWVVSAWLSGETVGKNLLLALGTTGEGGWGEKQPSISNQWEMRPG